MKIVVRSIFSGILFVLLIALLIRMVGMYTTAPTFTGLLETLQSVPEIKIPFLSTVTSNTLNSSWAILDGFRVFLRTILDLVDVAIFMVNGILSLITYIVYFMRWLFVF